MTSLCISPHRYIRVERVSGQLRGLDDLGRPNKRRIRARAPGAPASRCGPAHHGRHGADHGAHPRVERVANFERRVHERVHADST
eukprot:5583339-Pleurochrysis_carterae.AAC.1